MRQIETITEEEIGQAQDYVFEMILPVTWSKEDFHDLIYSNDDDIRLTFLGALRLMDWLNNNGFELPKR